MSDTIWLEVTDGKEKTGGDRDNTILLELGTQLDALAEKLGVVTREKVHLHDSDGVVWV
jgi:hypothetical protein